MEPSLWGLLEAVQRLRESTYMTTASGVDESGRLIAVDLLIKDAMKEGVFQVKF